MTLLAVSVMMCYLLLQHLHQCPPPRVSIKLIAQAVLLAVFVFCNESNDCERRDEGNSNERERWSLCVANALKFVLLVNEDNMSEWQDNDQGFVFSQFVFGLLTYSHSSGAFWNFAFGRKAAESWSTPKSQFFNEEKGQRALESSSINKAAGFKEKAQGPKEIKLKMEERKWKACCVVL